MAMANDYLVGLHWHDVIVIGAGHNGLVAALMLAKRGLRVLVLEEHEEEGGACKTERPFAKVPGLATSTGAHALGLVPPELLERIGVDLPLLARDPHTFVPTTGSKYLVLGSSPEENHRQLASFFSEADAKAYDAMHAELAMIRDDVGPTWLHEPLTIEETAERYVRPSLRAHFVALCRKHASDYLDRWGIESDLLRKLLTSASGYSGMSFLTHHMARLPESGGAWMLVQGGMGTVTRIVADEARRHGAQFRTRAKVASLVVEGNVARGVVTKDGQMHHATSVVCNADPLRMRDLVGRERLHAEYNHRLDGYQRDGTLFQLSLALKALPDFTCWPGGAFHLPGFAPTIHLFTDDAATPAVEWHVQTTLDPSMRDPEGHHDSALVVSGVPWTVDDESFSRHVLSIADRFAPKTSELVVDSLAMSPGKIEERFGLSRGHTSHVDDSFGFADRLPYATPIQGLYSCSAGCHPASGVVGAAGHNAAMRVMKDMGKTRY